jgi:hypothetical protein
MISWFGVCHGRSPLAIMSASPMEASLRYVDNVGLMALVSVH